MLMQARCLVRNILGVTSLIMVGLLPTVAQAQPDLQTTHPQYVSRLPQIEGGVAFRSADTPAELADLAAKGGPKRDLVPVWTYALGAATLSSPRLADVDGDGVKDIVIATYDPDDPYSAGRVYVFDMQGNIHSGWPITTIGPVPASPAVADVDNDGDAEVIVGSWQRAYIWNHDGTDLSGWPKSIGSYNSPAVVDVDGDGDLEIIYCATNKRLYVWHHDGSTLPGWPYTAPELVQSAVVADIDGDDALEIAAGTYEGPVSPDPFEFYVWELDGSVATGWPVATSGVVKAIAALGDLDNDGTVEIVGCAYDSSNNDYLYVWDANGNLESGWPVRVRYARLSSPTLGDLDGDGDLEIVIGGLEPGAFLEQVYAFQHDGTAVSGWPVVLDFAGNHGNINNSPIVADIDGDPAQVEVVVKVWDNIFALHADGTVVDGFPYALSDENHSGTITPTQAVGDLDGDRDVEYVFVSTFGNMAFFDEPHAFSRRWAYWPTFKHDAHNTGYLPPLCLGDVDFDGDVDLGDLTELLAHYGLTAGALYEDGDLDGDADVDLNDLTMLLANYGSMCP
jgi:hypothetical protein